jgi:hypothetical protein
MSSDVVKSAAARTKGSVDQFGVERVLKKAALFGLLFLVGAGIGSYAGWKLGSSFESTREFHAFRTAEEKAFLRTYESMASLWIVNMRSATILQDPKYGSEGRREDLNLVLDAAQKGRTQATDPATLTLIEVETGITYARFVMVEEAAGNLPASQAWMQKAQTALKQAGWKNYSEPHLREIVQARNLQDSCDCPGKK